MDPKHDAPCREPHEAALVARNHSLAKTAWHVVGRGIFQDRRAKWPTTEAVRLVWQLKP